MINNTIFKKATQADSSAIWNLLQGAIARRKADGSNQWQDGYPNPEVVANDIREDAGYVLTQEGMIIGYVAILINDEPEYARLKGKWLTNDDFVVFHRVAVAETHLGKGVAKELFLHIEEFAKEHEIKSIKADTNFDNSPMLNLFEKFNYCYCGEVSFRGTPRKAFEKVLKY
jgi:GNAT superfamily N-acetyltransferase